MVASEPASPNSPPETKKRRGLFSFLFKSTLGCAAFAFGALVVLVLLLPTIASRSLAASTAEDFFDQIFQGSLKVAKVDLAWFGEQTLEGVVISDPAGGEIGRVSVTLPSIVRCLDWKSGRLGRVRVALEGDLVADDQGVTNLQRALAPRAQASTPSDAAAAEASVGSGELQAMLNALSLDLEVDVARLTWSDADTRRVGKPFEVRDLAASVIARPGEPTHVRAAGKLASETPGRVSIDATVKGPFALDRPWPVGSVDAEVQVTGFSTAMVDGLANLGGDLKDLFGPRFDLALHASNATRTAGDLDVELNSERTSVRVKGRFADGAFVSAGEPALTASIAEPRAILERHLAQLVPPRMRLAWSAESAPITVRVEDLALPIPAGAAQDPAGLRAALEPLRARVAIAWPGSLAIDDEALRKAGASAALGALQLDLLFGPGTLVVDGRLACAPSASIGAPSNGSIQVHARVNDPWTLVSGGTLPVSDVDLHVIGLPTVWLDAFQTSGVSIAEGVGDALDLHATVEGASLDAGSATFALRATRLEVDSAGRIEGGAFRSAAQGGLRVHATLPPAWIEKVLAAYLPPGQDVRVGSGALDVRLGDLVVPLPRPGAPSTEPFAPFVGVTSGALTCTLPTLRWSDESMRAAHLAAELSDASLTAHLAADGRFDATVRSVLDTGTKGKLDLEVKVPDVWAAARAQTLQALPPIDAALRVDGLPTTLVETLAGMKGALTEWVGAQISVGLDVRHASVDSGSVQLQIDTPMIAAGFAGKLEQGVFTARGDDGLRVRARVLPSAWERVVAPLLPANARVTGAIFSEPSEFAVRNLSFTIPERAATSTSATVAPVVKSPLQTVLESLTADVSLAIPGATWSQGTAGDAAQPITLSKIECSAHVAPGAPCEGRLAAALDTGMPGQIEATILVKTPMSSFADDAAELPPIDVRVAVRGVSTATLLALAAAPPSLVKLLGARIDVELAAEGATPTMGALRVGVKTDTTTLALAGRLQSAAFVCSGDEGLDLVIAVPREYVESEITALLPAGTRLALPPDAGPVRVVVRDTRIALPQTTDRAVAVRDASAPAGVADKDAAAETAVAVDPALALAFLADLALRLEATLPALQYADAATQAAGQPVVVRDMQVKVDLAPGALPAATIHATIDDAEPGAVDVSVRALDSLAKLAEPAGLAHARVAIDMRANHVPTALVDVLAKQDGLLLDTLGPRLDLTAKADGLSVDEGAFVVDLSSPQASLHAMGRMKDGLVTMSATDRSVARFGLTPLASQRVVGALVPMMFNLTKPAGAEPVVLTLDDLSLPLDADMTRLDATVHLNLGEVSYRLLPGLDSMLGSLADAKSVRIPMLTIPIRKGIASYDDLPLVIGGRACKFQGTFSLVDHTFKMSTEIPLAAFGKKINAALDGARDAMDPNTLVPIEIRGTWKKPKVSIGDEFLQRVLESAARGGLQDLLKGLGGKKKKKD